MMTKQLEGVSDNTKSTNKGLRILIVCLIGLFLLCRCFNEASKSTTTTRSSSPTSQPTMRKVEYIVTSTISEYGITYNNQDGNTEQHDIRVREWSKTVTVRSGYFAYISAQIGGNGKITCQIKLDGVVVESATSNGKYVIATCSGSVP